MCPKDLANTLSNGLMNVWNKYVSNDSSRWDKMYDQKYAEKLDCADQRARHYVIAGMITDMRPAVRSILDIGCGTGTTYSFLHHLGIEYHGIDISQNAIKQARETFGTSCDHQFDVCDVKSFVTQKKYDVVFLTEVLYYLPVSEIEAELARATSLLRNEQSQIIISMSENAKAKVLWKMCDTLSEPIHNIALQSDLVGSKWRVKGYEPLKSKALAQKEISRREVGSAKVATVGAR